MKNLFAKINNNKGMAAITVVCILAFTAIVVPVAIFKTTSALNQTERYKGFNSAYYVAEGACQYELSQISNKIASNTKSKADEFFTQFESDIGINVSGKAEHSIGTPIFTDNATANVTVKRTATDTNTRKYQITSKGNSNGASRTLFFDISIDYTKINNSNVFDTMAIFACGNYLNINSGNDFYGDVGTNATQVTNRGTFVHTVDGKLVRYNLTPDMRKTVSMPTIPVVPDYTRYVSDSDFTSGEVYYNDSEHRIENNFNKGTAVLKLTDERTVYKLNNTNNMKATLEIDCSGKQQTLVMDSIKMNNEGTIIVKNGSLNLYVIGDIGLASSCKIARDTSNCNKFNVICDGTVTLNSSSTFTGNLLLRNDFPTLNSGVVFTGNIICAANDGTSINSGFTMNGLIYAPGVKINISGGDYVGSLVFNEINFNSGNKITFSKPDISTLPANIINSSSGGVTFTKGPIKEQ